MADTKDIGRLSPDKLLVGFSAGRIWAGLLISLAVHVVVIGGSSLGYMYGWIDPKWASARQEEMKKLEEAKRAAALKAEVGAKPSSPEKEGEPGKGTSGEEGATSDKPGATGGGASDKETPAKNGKKMTKDERLLKERADTPVVKAITESAKPEDIPKEPGLGISIEDTNLE